MAHACRLGTGDGPDDRESAVPTLALNLFAMVAVAACAPFAVDDRISVAAACAVGMVALGAAMRLPLRWVPWMLPPACSPACVLRTTDLAGFPCSPLRRWC